MPTITFVDHRGVRRDIEIAEGHSLMEGARDAGIDAIAADCGGACACATCHVYIDDAWQARVSPRDSMEEEMLDFAAAQTDSRSRLACQITINASHNGLTVHTPETQG
ncbi:2Fe-2S iron-sulfur cluster-binding protein [Aliisedimentitalea scapharcae]|uniref:2Fe-2S iron-sulfur cluster-binding protein n=1 Tax=Aliisedimentitalea scapharcae TaxID=1524259 RepID=A0ABZ2XU16_9RHOB|nr:(2Fe-2S)-binding protein [Rhodobacteraceae bacterium M382]